MTKEIFLSENYSCSFSRSFSPSDDLLSVLTLSQLLKIQLISNVNKEMFAVVVESIFKAENKIWGIFVNNVTSNLKGS
jgi:hypothetical protein